MSVLKIDTWGNWKIAWVQSSDPQNAVAALEQGHVDGIGISSYHGFSGNDISFLSAISEKLKGLVFPRADDYDITLVEGFKNLRFLALTDPEQGLDLRQMTDLEDLSLDWLPQFKLPGASAPIRKLCLRRYKSQTHNLSQLPAYSQLTTLGLVQSNLTSLAGVERFANLTNGNFAYMTKLEIVKPLAQTSVHELTFEACKKIKDLAALSQCPKLEILRYANCADLESLSFLNSFHSLQEFRFVKVTIKDGDMSPLLRLKKVGFLKHKGYSHTPEQVREIIGEPPFIWDQTKRKISTE